MKMTIELVLRIDDGAIFQDQMAIELGCWEFFDLQAMASHGCVKRSSVCRCSSAVFAACPSFTSTTHQLTRRCTRPPSRSFAAHCRRVTLDVRPLVKPHGLEPTLYKSKDSARLLLIGTKSQWGDTVHSIAVARRALCRAGNRASRFPRATLYQVARWLQYLSDHS